jgi:hypothetical protein
MGSATTWHIPDCYIPVDSTGGVESHESVCVLNDGDQDALLVFEAFFADREPLRSEPVRIPADRCLHLRTSEPEAVGGLALERGVPYGLRITSDRPVHLQYSRLDTTQPAYALMTVMP